MSNIKQETGKGNGGVAPLPASALLLKKRDGEQGVQLFACINAHGPHTILLDTIQ